jgi:hypothetical protein
LSLPNIALHEQSSKIIDSSRSGSRRASVSVRWRARVETIEGYEAMHAIRKGQVRWVAKGDPVGQRQFIHSIFGVAA